MLSANFAKQCYNYICIFAEHTLTTSSTNSIKRSVTLLPITFIKNTFTATWKQENRVWPRYETPSHPPHNTTLPRRSILNDKQLANCVQPQDR